MSNERTRSAPSIRELITDVMPADLVLDSLRRETNDSESGHFCVANEKIRRSGSRSMSYDEEIKSKLDNSSLDRPEREYRYANGDLRRINYDQSCDSYHSCQCKQEECEHENIESPLIASYGSHRYAHLNDSGDFFNTLERSAIARRHKASTGSLHMYESELVDKSLATISDPGRDTNLTSTSAAGAKAVDSPSEEKARIGDDLKRSEEGNVRRLQPVEPELRFNLQNPFSVNSIPVYKVQVPPVFRVPSDFSLNLQLQQKECTAVSSSQRYTFGLASPKCDPPYVSSENSSKNSHPNLYSPRIPQPVQPLPPAQQNPRPGCPPDTVIAPHHGLQSPGQKQGPAYGDEPQKDTPRSQLHAHSGPVPPTVQSPQAVLPQSAARPRQLSQNLLPFPAEQVPEAHGNEIPAPSCGFSYEYLQQLQQHQLEELSRRQHQEQITLDQQRKQERHELEVKQRLQTEQLHRRHEQETLEQEHLLKQRRVGSVPIVRSKVVSSSAGLHRRRSSKDLPPDSAAGDKGAPTEVPRRRGNLPKDVTNILRNWLQVNINHPYPSEEDKMKLAAQTQLTMVQVSNWFINARRRNIPPHLRKSKYS